MKTKTLKTLTMKNDWGYLTYYLGTTPIKSLRRVYINQQPYKVSEGHRTETVSDMGHQSTVSSLDFTVKTSVFNKKATFSLEKLLNLKVKVLVDEKDINLKNNKE